MAVDGNADQGLGQEGLQLGCQPSQFALVLLASAPELQVIDLLLQVDQIILCQQLPKGSQDGLVCLRIPPCRLFCGCGARAPALTLVLATGRLSQYPPQLILASAGPGSPQPSLWTPAGPFLALQKEAGGWPTHSRMGAWGKMETACSPWPPNNPWFEEAPALPLTLSSPACFHTNLGMGSIVLASVQSARGQHRRLCLMQGITLNLFTNLFPYPRASCL